MTPTNPRVVIKTEVNPAGAERQRRWIENAMKSIQPTDPARPGVQQTGKKAG